MSEKKAKSPKQVDGMPACDCGSGYRMDYIVHKHECARGEAIRRNLHANAMRRGFTAVPWEPTKAMVAAARQAEKRFQLTHGGSDTPLGFEDIWRVMYSAAIDSSDAASRR